MANRKAASKTAKSTETTPTASALSAEEKLLAEIREKQKALEVIRTSKAAERETFAKAVETALAKAKIPSPPEGGVTLTITVTGSGEITIAAPGRARAKSTTSESWEHTGKAQKAPPAGMTAGEWYARRLDSGESPSAIARELGIAASSVSASAKAWKARQK